MYKQLFLTFILGTILAFVLAACGGTADSAPTSAAPTLAAESAPAGEGRTLTIGAEADAPQTFMVTDESQASYIVNEEFLVDALSKLGIEAGRVVVVGTTPGVTGEIRLNFGSPDLLEAAQFTVDMTGLRTDQNRRDNWLQDNAIETNRFPEATFVATAVSGLPVTYTEGEEIGFQLTGDLTVRDVTNPVTFDVSASLTGNTLRGTATLPLQMTDFGITPPDFVNTLTVANSFSIEVAIVAQSQ